MRYLRWILLVAFLLLPTIVFAHAQVVRTEPEEGAQLATSPAMVRIFFDEPIEAAFSTIQLFDETGKHIDDGTGGRAADDSAVLALKLPPLGAGVYTVVWQVTSSDSHVVKGNFAFTVLGTGSGAAAPQATQSAPAIAPTPQPIPVAETSPTPSPVLPALARGLMLLGALLAAGAWLVFAGVIAPLLPFTQLGHAAQRWRTIGTVSLQGLIIASLVMLLLHTSLVAGTVDGANIMQVASATRFGQALVARMLIGLVMIALLVTGGVPHWKAWQTLMAAVLSAGLLLSFSVASHAAAQPQPIIDITLDWLHLMATALWVGGLFLLAFVLPILRRALPQNERAPTLARVISRFSTLALASVAVLTVTGTYAALQHIASPGELLSSDYGRTLLVKLVLFVGLILLGAYNLLLVRPRLGRWADQSLAVVESWQRRIQQSLRGEVGLALLVIFVVGLLTTLAPPVDDQPVAAQAAIAPTTMSYPTITPLPTRTVVPSLPFDETKTAADLKVRLQVAPASLGDNQFTVTATDAAGQPVETQLVRLRFTMMIMDMGETKIVAEPQGDGRYTLSASPMSMVGPWQIEVTVRRATADDVVVPFVVPVGE